MIARSLFQTNKYFASKFKCVPFRNENFLLPSPPSKPLTEQAIFQQLLRNKKKESNIKIKDIQKDEKLASQLKEQAKLERENNLKKYEAAVKEYEEKFALPKKPRNPFIFYFLEKYVKSSDKPTEAFKKISQEYNQLPEQTQKIYKEKSAEDRRRYNEESLKFQNLNKDYILPQIRPIGAYAVYLQKQLQLDPKQKFSNIGSAWKSLSEEQKKQYEEEATKINAEAKQRLVEFQKKNNISDEDLKSSIKEKKQRSKSVSEKQQDSNSQQ
ncbi:hypothetical protein ABPG74_001110 [Tetrahymena malaccensis]